MSSVSAPAPVPAPPMNERPRCLYCGARLKPLFDSVRTTTDQKRRRYAWPGSDGREVRENDLGAEQDSKGVWFVWENKTKIVSSWTGLYNSRPFC